MDIIQKNNIYKQKTDYYQNMLNNNTIDKQNNNLYLYKLNKYKMKTAIITNHKPYCKLLSCELKYNEKRNPSNCDRILYKGDIQILKYDVYESDFIKLSDHLMVFGIFSHKNENGIIFTWNIAKLHDNIDIGCGIDKLIRYFGLFENNYAYIVFCLQESPNDDKFIKILIEYFLKTQYKVSINSSNSLTQQNVRLVVFHKNKGTPLKDVSNYKIQLIEGIDNAVENLGEGLKKIKGTKSYVMIKINDITFISCHLPINVDINDPDNYLGNNLRIDALKKIITDFSNDKNVIIAGDLNFRIKPKPDNNDQLDELLPSIKDYNEFGKLSKHTCKVIPCNEQK